MRYKRQTLNKQELFDLNYPLVKHIAKKYLKWNEPLVDLMQVGAVGLLKAIDHYSAKRGRTFVAYAAPTIDGEIRHYIRDKFSGIKISRKLIELNTKVNKVIESTKVATGKTLTNKEVARKLKIKQSRIEKAKKAVRTHYTISLNQPISSLKGTEANVITLEDIVGKADAYDDLMEQISVKDALAQLPTRNQSILKMLFIDDSVQSNIAKKHKITQAQVSRIIQQSLAELKNILVH
ncbi:sigma-70 family RNA polymerase sigma factor [Candidatus Margulisiibacteriota bacterium]